MQKTFVTIVVGSDTRTSRGHERQRLRERRRWRRQATPSTRGLVSMKLVLEVLRTFTHSKSPTIRNQLCAGGQARAPTNRHSELSGARRGPAPAPHPLAGHGAS